MNYHRVYNSVWGVNAPSTDQVNRRCKGDDIPDSIMEFNDVISIFKHNPEDEPSYFLARNWCIL